MTSSSESAPPTNPLLECAKSYSVDLIALSLASKLSPGAGIVDAWLKQCYETALTSRTLDAGDRQELQQGLNGELPYPQVVEQQAFALIQDLQAYVELERSTGQMTSTSPVWVDGICRIMELALPTAISRLNCPYTKPWTASLNAVPDKLPGDIIGLASFVLLSTPDNASDDDDSKDTTPLAESLQGGRSSAGQRAQPKVSVPHIPLYDRDPVTDSLRESCKWAVATPAFCQSGQLSSRAILDVEVCTEVDEALCPVPVSPLHDSMPVNWKDSSIFPSPFDHPHLVPVLSIATEDEIVPLIASALHQSRIVLHGLPIIALACGHGQEVCKVFVGWIGEAEEGRNATRLHIGVPESTYGVFDLRSSDVFALGRFLLLICQHATTIRSNWYTGALAGEFTRDITWRADTELEERFRQDGFDIAVSMWRTTVPGPSGLYPLPPSDAYGGPRHMSANMTSISWPSNPQPWFLEGRLNEELDCILPGIGMWSADHRVLTLGLVLGGASHVRFPTIYDRLLAALGITDGIPLLTLEGRPGSPPGCDPTSLRGRDHIRGLAFRVSRAFGEGPMLEQATASHCKELWEDVLRYWKNVISEETQSQQSQVTSIDCLGGMLVEYPRCTTYDVSLPYAQRERSGTYEAAYDNLCDIFNNWKNDNTLNYIFYIKHYATRPLTEECREIRLELLDTTSHSLKVLGMVYERSPYPHPPSGPSDDSSLWRRCIDEVRGRLVRYPVEGSIDAAVALSLRELVEEVRRVTGDEVVEDFMDSLRFLRLPDGKEPERHPVKCRSLFDSSMPLVSRPTFDTEAFHLPLLLFTFQDCGTSLQDTTRNQQRLACTSAAKFLAALGVKDFPVFGLSICGPYGIPCAAWCSSQDECCYILDRATAPYRFDLTHSDGVLRYIAFLSSIEEHGRELQRLWEQVKPEFLQRLQTEDGRRALSWTASAQLSEYSLWPDDEDSDDAE
ncbi:hypothetical protein OH77DRAFT_1525343 [Trametes cingulata]|nr:hypothetical protein OH77DRAFT_1525343 [Trametes cingulata]